MYILNINKMQQLPRGKDGRVSIAAKRIRLPQTAFEVKPFMGRGAWLRPTKGWLSRNLVRMDRHGKIVQELDWLKQQSIHRMQIIQKERKNQKSNAKNT